MDNLSVSVLIPAYNEEKNIYQTILALREITEIREIVVVDDASNDSTADRAAAAGAKVISLKRNVGKGGALNIGLGQVTGDIIALLDADLGCSASDVNKLITPVLSDRFDMAIARFPKAKKKGGFGLVKGLAQKGIRHLTGLDLYSPLSGQRVMKRKVIDSLGRFESGFGVEVGMTIDAVRKGFKITEVDVQMTHSETGRDLRGFLHRGKQFVQVAQVLAKRVVLR